MVSFLQSLLSLFHFCVFFSQLSELVWKLAEEKGFQSASKHFASLMDIWPTAMKVTPKNPNFAQEKKPGPTMKGWFSTGNKVADEMLAWGNMEADETLSWDNVVAMLAIDSECKGVRGQKGRHKSGNNQSWPTLSSRSSCVGGMCSKARSRSSKSGGLRR